MKPKNRFSIKKRLKSFRYAFNGLLKAIKTQHNLWIHLSAAVVVIISGFYFQISHIEWMVIVLAIGGVITAELINTAIEWIVDLVSPDHHPLAGAAKDVAAGAVLLIALTSVVIGILVFLPYLQNLL